jgi:uncharacterized membrane protein YkvA (DUF1232 family)
VRRDTLIVKKLKERVCYYRCIAVDERTPVVSKFLILAALAYLASPIDLVPDFIPILGQLDDLVIVPALIWGALLLVPSEVKAHAYEVSTQAS